MANYKYHILLCGGTGCTASDSPKIKSNFEQILAEKNLSDDVQVIATGCFGFCEKGPIVKILPDNTFYTQVKPEDCREIIDEHIIKGRKVQRLLYENPEEPISASMLSKRAANPCSLPNWKHGIKRSRNL